MRTFIISNEIYSAWNCTQKKITIENEIWKNSAKLFFKMQVKEMNHLKSENINELKYEHALKS